jgi:predicted lipid-binding transport protein (Tim44 family)
LKKYLFSLLLAVTALSITATDAEARRLGGGGNFGRQSSARQAPAPQAAPQQAVKPAAPTAAPVPAATQPAPVVPPKPGIPWRGILGGAALGLGMSALMSHFGMSGAMGGMIGSLLMAATLAAVVIFALRWFRRPATAPTGNLNNGAGYVRTAASEVVPISPSSPPIFQAESAATPIVAADVVGADASADFDIPNFLRTAKTSFIRMQAAWDKADVNDISEFTTPEMFAELRLQILERGASPNHTDVVSIAAEMLSVETVGDDYHASVKFVGVIKEDEHAVAEPFSEIWNMSRPILGHNNWLLAGIQQVT